MLVKKTLQRPWTGFKSECTNSDATSTLKTRLSWNCEAQGPEDPKIGSLIHPNCFQKRSRRGVEGNFGDASKFGWVREPEFGKMSQIWDAKCEPKCSKNPFIGGVGTHFISKLSFGKLFNAFWDVFSCRKRWQICPKCNALWASVFELTFHVRTDDAEVFAKAGIY